MSKWTAENAKIGTPVVSFRSRYPADHGALCSVRAITSPAAVSRVRVGRVREPETVAAQQKFETRLQSVLKECSTEPGLRLSSGVRCRP